VSRKLKPRGKIVRRFGVNIYEMPKYDQLLSKKSNPPGRADAKRKKISNYGLQLLEKQKLKFAYEIGEKQFRNLYYRAKKMKGRTGDNILILLESRLDNAVFRLGLAESRSQARQMVSHRHIVLNGKSVNVPSITLSPGDIIGLKRKDASINMGREALLRRKGISCPWLDFDEDSLSGTMRSNPEPSWIKFPVDMQRVVEYYAR